MNNWNVIGFPCFMQPYWSWKFITYDLCSRIQQNFCLLQSWVLGDETFIWLSVCFRFIQDCLKKKRWQSVVNWITRSSQLKLATILPRTTNFHQNLQYKLSFPSNPSSKACSKKPAKAPSVASREPKVWKRTTKPVNKSPSMPENLIFQTRMTTSKHICKVCNGE